MVDSFEVSVLDCSFHNGQSVGSVYQCNEWPYKSSFKHAKHLVPVSAMSSQAVSLICDHCGIELRSRHGLSCHIKSKHENTFKYTCQSCGRGFQGLWIFRGGGGGHLRSHNDALKGSCSVCSNEFTYCSSLADIWTNA